VEAEPRSDGGVPGGPSLTEGGGSSQRSRLCASKCTSPNRGRTILHIAGTPRSAPPPPCLLH
jgi:hypothetical protein